MWLYFFMTCSIKKLRVAHALIRIVQCHCTCNMRLVFSGVFEKSDPPHKSAKCQGSEIQMQIYNSSVFTGVLKWTWIYIGKFAKACKVNIPGYTQIYSGIFVKCLGKRSSPSLT